MCEFQLEIVGRFHQLEGVVAVGNDYGNPGVERGMPLREMKLLLEAGLSPMEVLEAGTRRAAQVCGHGNELGTMEPGKLADIIIVDGNPLEDIEALDRVKWVIKDGQVVGTSNEL
jgi:imidazolonepropionase-like amidohydrolase